MFICMLLVIIIIIIVKIVVVMVFKHKRGKVQIQKRINAKSYQVRVRYVAQNQPCKHRKQATEATPKSLS